MEKEERRRYLLRASDAGAPVHRASWDICGEIDLVAVPSGWQDPIHFVATSMAFGPDLPGFEFHSHGPCRSPVMDHVRARIDSNQNVFVPVGDASRLWSNIQRHLVAEDYFVQQISFGIGECRSYGMGISDFAGFGSWVFGCTGDRGYPRSRLYAAWPF